MKVLALVFVFLSSVASAQTPQTYRLGPGWATFGVSLPQGTATAVTIGTLPTQTDVKNRWPDGSLRFAVATTKVLTAGSFPVTSGTAPAGTFTPVAPPFAVQFVIATGAGAGATYTATLGAYRASDLWLDGPLVKEWRTRVTPLAGAVAHDNLSVVFDVRSYVDGDHRIDVQVYNARDNAKMDFALYNVSIVSNGAVVYALSSVKHSTFTAWRPPAPIYVGTGREATVTYDFSGHYAAKTLPQPLAGVVKADPAVGDPLKFGPLRFGLFNPMMNAAGGRPELGPLSGWDVQFMVHQTAAQRTALLHDAFNGLLSWTGTAVTRTDDSLYKVTDPVEGGMTFIPYAGQYPATLRAPRESGHTVQFAIVGTPTTTTANVSVVTPGASMEELTGDYSYLYLTVNGAEVSTFLTGVTGTGATGTITFPAQAAAPTAARYLNTIGGFIGGRQTNLGRGVKYPTEEQLPRLDTEHPPPVGIVAYYATGDRAYLDAAKLFVDAFVFMSAQNPIVAGDKATDGSDIRYDRNAVPGAHGVMWYVFPDPRAYARNLRNFVFAAQMTPDADPDRPYFLSLVNDNYAWMAYYNDKRKAPGTQWGDAAMLWEGQTTSYPVMDNTTGTTVVEMPIFSQVFGHDEIAWAFYWGQQQQIFTIPAGALAFAKRLVGMPVAFSSAPDVLGVGHGLGLYYAVNAHRTGPIGAKIALPATLAEAALWMNQSSGCCQHMHGEGDNVLSARGSALTASVAMFNPAMVGYTIRIWGPYGSNWNEAQYRTFSAGPVRVAYPGVYTIKAFLDPMHVTLDRAPSAGDATGGSYTYVGTPPIAGGGLNGVENLIAIKLAKVWGVPNADVALANALAYENGGIEADARTLQWGYALDIPVAGSAPPPVIVPPVIVPPPVVTPPPPVVVVAPVVGTPVGLVLKAGKVSVLAAPLLSWTKTKNATSYDIEVTNALGEIVLSGHADAASATFQLPATQPAGTYAWRVRACIGTTCGTWAAGTFAR